MKNITKKLAVLALAGLMAMSFSACDSTDKNSSAENSSSQADDASSNDDNNNDNINANNNGGDESAPPANQNSTAETFKDYSNKSVENGKSAKWFWMDTGTEDLLGDSDIFELSFKIKDGTADGNYNVVINDLAICNTDLAIVDAKLIDGTITVGSADAPAAQETPSETAITLVNTSGNAGDTVKMKVKLSKNPGFCTVQLGINYDSSALELVDITNTGILEDLGSVVKNLGEE